MCILHHLETAQGCDRIWFTYPTHRGGNYVTGPASQFLNCQLHPDVWKHPCVLRDSLLGGAAVAQEVVLVATLNGRQDSLFGDRERRARAHRASLRHRHHFLFEFTDKQILLLLLYFSFVVLLLRRRAHAAFLVVYGCSIGGRGGHAVIERRGSGALGTGMAPTWASATVSKKDIGAVVLCQVGAWMAGFSFLEPF